MKPVCPNCEMPNLLNKERCLQCETPLNETARQVIVHGIDSKGFTLVNRAVAEQGSPSINRKDRRKSQRVGDRARKRKGIT